MFHRNNRAQVEFISLAIVIILLIFGFLFFIKYSVKKPDTTTQDITNIQLATNFINALIESQTNCSQATFSDLLEDAALPNPVIKCEDESDSITRIDEMTKAILNNTLDEWKKGYELNITIPGQTLPVYKNPPDAGCEAKRVIQPAYYPLAKGISLELKICDIR